MPDISVPDHGMDLVPQLHNTLLPPNEAAEPSIHQLPEQIQAPTRVGGLLELLPGEESQHAMGQRGLTSAQALEGKMPIREAYGHPPDLPDLQTQGSTAWEPVFIIPKAHVHVHKVQRPVPDEGAHMCPNLWLNLGVIIVNPDTCIRSASQLKGEQNINLPSVGSELHAAPSAPQISSSSLSPLSLVPPPSDTLICGNQSHGEGTATKRHTIKGRPCPKPSKPPNPHKVMQEAGGVLLTLGNISVLPKNTNPFRLAGTAENTNIETGGVERTSIDLHKSGGVSASDNPPSLPGDDGSPGDLNSLGLAYTVADAEGVKPLRIDAYEQGGAHLLMGTAPALAKDTVSIGLADKAETASTAKPEVSESWAQDKAGCRHEVNVQPHKALP